MCPESNDRPEPGLHCYRRAKSRQLARVTSPLCFPEREAGAVAVASRAQETSGKKTHRKAHLFAKFDVTFARSERYGELQFHLRDQFLLRRSFILSEQHGVSHGVLRGHPVAFGTFPVSP